MPHARRARLLGVVALATVLVSGCALAGLGPGEQSRTSGSQASGSRAPAATSSPSTPGGPGTPGSPSTPGTDPGRPVEPVPDVTPPGFVPPPPGHGTQRYREQHVTWTPCNTGRECASVTVPLDWSDPDGQAITLALARINATHGPKLGTLFLNPGGPGGSGVDMINWFDATGLGRYDIVSWDPRGAGRSTPVRCENGAKLDAYFDVDVSPDSAAEDRALRAADRQFGMSCLARSGVLLEHVSTLDTVNDLDLLRALLGSTKLNLLGFSYGTLLGALYAQEFPDHVGRMVLDGAVDITGAPAITQAGGFERMLDAFGTWCADRRCGLGATKATVLDTITDLLQGLDAHPLTVGRRELSQTLAVDGVIAPLYSGAAGFPALRDALVTARQGDGSALLRLADGFNGRGANGMYSPMTAAFSAIRCSEPDKGLAGARSDLAAATKDAPTLGPFLGLDYVCPEWPVAARPALPTIVGKGAPPILVIGTTGDPATPYEYAVSMAKQLTSGVLLTRVGTGHTAYGRGDTCIDKAVRAFLNHGTVPPDGTRC